MPTKPKTSLEIFINSLESSEKKLLQTYSSKKTYDDLSEKFDELLKSTNED